MKLKSKKKFWITLIVIILIIVGILVYAKNTSKASQTINSGTTTDIVNTKVSKQTITNTLTGSGAVSSALTENLTLNTARYFETMCVEVNDYVKEGENILEYTNGTYLTAPYNLVVTAISVPEADAICTSSNYITVQSVDKLNMTLSIDETEISTVKAGQEVQIIVNAYEDKTYTGAIEKINEIGTYNTSGTSFTATVAFENDGNIKIGMSASCTVILEKVEDVIAVPIEAVQKQNGEKYVIIVKDDGTTENKAITTGISNDAYVEVKDGLEGSETIQMEQQVSNSASGGNRQQGGGFGGQNSGQIPSFEWGGTTGQMPNFSSGTMPGGMSQ